MKQLDTALMAALAARVTTLATCFRLSRRDGVVMGFTNHDQDLVIDGVTYTAATGWRHASIDSHTTLAVNNLDVQGLLSDERITDDDLLNGVYDGARVDIVLVDYTQLPATFNKQQLVWLHTAFIAEVTLENGTFVAELKSLMDYLSRNQRPLYTPTCRVQRLGDERCQVSLNGYSHDYAVLALNEPHIFTHSGTVQTVQYFRYGTLRFTSGANKGRQVAVKDYTNNQFTLVEALPYAIAAGDSFKAIRGCDRQFTTCRDVFDNVINFRGEPPHLLPGSDKLLAPV